MGGENGNGDGSDVKKLSRNERKRLYREQQQQHPQLSQPYTSDAPQKKRRYMNMLAKGYLPLSDDATTSASHWRGVIEYDGTQFNGFQAQEQKQTLRTVQEAIEDALHRTTGEELRIRGASRTDKGVHARGQVIAFHSRCTSDAQAFRNAINTRLPEDIQCRHLEKVADDFDPRAQSTGKTYTYTICNGAVRPVLDRHNVWHIKQPLDIVKMQVAIAHLVAPPLAKDYSSFTPNKPEHDDDHICRLASIDLSVTESQDQEVRRLVFTLQGDRFLYKMVRNLIGTLVDVGLGLLEPDAIPEILQAKDRSNAGQGAPPQGLTLEQVRYTSNN